MRNPSPYRATHPGGVLKDELRARGIRQKDFARDIDIQPSMLNEIIRGKRPVTKDIALLLKEALDIPEDFWLQFQRQYELDASRKEPQNVIC